MKKNFTLLSTSLLVSAALMAGTPTMDGNFDGEATWGAPIGVGDGVEGWSGANARRLYVTMDANFVYFGAACRADGWQQFVFAVNTKTGGNGTDSWGRTITYNHSNLPDFLFRGDIAGSNYAEYHVWNGTAWTGLGSNINGAGTEVKGAFNNDTREGFIEIRVPKATLGDAVAIDVQFIITGNNSDEQQRGHGSFDAIPNDNNTSAWEGNGRFTSLSNYVSNVVLPATLGQFAGALQGNIVNLRWSTLTEVNVHGFEIEQSIDTRSWQNVGKVYARNSTNGANYAFTLNKVGASVSYYRLKIVDKDGSFVHSRMVMLRAENARELELIGNPVRNVINIAINQPMAETLQAELIDINGRRISNTVYNHPGGASVLQINTGMAPAGTYMIKVSGSTLQGVMRVVKQ